MAKTSAVQKNLKRIKLQKKTLQFAHYVLIQILDIV